MVILIPSRRADGTLVFKTCVYGPSESGRKTVLEQLYEKGGLASGKLNEIKDEKGSMLSFERIIGKVYNVIFQVYTFNVSDESNAKIVLKGTDAILFIWDSLIDKWGNNISSLKTLIRIYGNKLIPPESFAPPDVTTVILANKCDLEDIIEISKIRKALDIAHFNHSLIYETIAINGVNVKRAFVYAARQGVLNHYKKLDGKSMEDTLLELSNRKEKANETIKGLSEVYKSIKISEICSRINIDFQETVNLIEDLIKNGEINAFIEGESLIFSKTSLLDLEFASETILISNFIDVTRGGDWAVEGDSSVFKFKVKICNNSKFVLTNIQILLTSIPNSLESQIDRYSIKALRPNSFESPMFKLKARESCIGDVIEGIVIFNDPIGNLTTIHIEPFKIEYVCNLLVPKVISEDQFERNVLQMYEQEMILDCNLSPNELKSEVTEFLTQSNFFLIESSESLNDPDFKKLKAYAEGKYDHQDVGLLVIMQKLADQNNKLIFKAMSDNEAKITDILRDISKKCDNLKIIPEYTTEIICNNCEHKIQANGYMRMKETIICEKCGYEIKNIARSDV